jgi:hypothetical protein
MAEPAPPTNEVQNLHLDEVTGEKVSKTELKKRQKQRDIERKKAEKAASAPPKASAKPKAAAEEDLNPNQVLHMATPCLYYWFSAKLTRDPYCSSSRFEAAKSTTSFRVATRTRTRTSSR